MDAPESFAIARDGEGWLVVCAVAGATADGVQLALSMTELRDRLGEVTLSGELLLRSGRTIAADVHVATDGTAWMPTGKVAPDELRGARAELLAKP